MALGIVLWVAVDAVGDGEASAGMVEVVYGAPVHPASALTASARTARLPPSFVMTQPSQTSSVANPDGCSSTSKPGVAGLTPSETSTLLAAGVLSPA